MLFSFERGPIDARSEAVLPRFRPCKPGTWDPTQHSLVRSSIHQKDIETCPFTSTASKGGCQPILVFHFSTSSGSTLGCTGRKRDATRVHVVPVRCWSMASGFCH